MLCLMNGGSAANNFYCIIFWICNPTNQCHLYRAYLIAACWINRNVEILLAYGELYFLHVLLVSRFTSPTRCKQLNQLLACPLQLFKRT